MNLSELNYFLTDNKQPNFRLKQIINAVYKENYINFNDIQVLPIDLRDKLSENFDIIPFTIDKILKSKDTLSYKALLITADNKYIETVLIAAKNNTWSACISSQIGCKLGCKFCATGNSGYTRDLSAEEILGQVLFWKNYLSSNKLGKLTNIVYMGMGEPFLNWNNLNISLKKLIDPGLFDFSSRSISVSTSGITDGIIKLANEFDQVNLAISLHSANDETRSKLMPINHKHNLNDLKQALDYYTSKTNRKVFLEYIMLHKLTDTTEDADNLINFINSFEKKHLLHVNLISYNTTASKYKASTKDEIEKFQTYLQKNKINTTTRKSLGNEINGACGQLSGNKPKDKTD